MRLNTEGKIYKDNLCGVEVRRDFSKKALKKANYK